MFLNAEVESQLNNLLTNRPNELKTEPRKKHKMKDFIKQVRAGNGYRLKKTIIDNNCRKYLEKHPISTISPENIDISFQKLDEHRIVRTLDTKLSDDELIAQYPGYHCTQNIEFNPIVGYIDDEPAVSVFYERVIKLTAVKFKWSLRLSENHTYLFRYMDDGSIVIQNEFENHHLPESINFTLDKLYQLFKHELSRSDLDYIYKKLYNQQNSRNRKNTIAEVKSNINQLLSDEDLKKLDIIENGFYGNYFRYQEYITNRSELKIYLKKEVQNNGDFLKLHNHVETFKKEGDYR